MNMDPLQMIHESVKDVFEKLDEIGKQNAVTADILPKIDEELKKIPLLNNRILRIESIWAVIVGSGALVSIVATTTKAIGWW